MTLLLVLSLRVRRRKSARLILLFRRLMVEMRPEGWTAQGPDGIDHRVSASFPNVEWDCTEVITGCGLFLVIHPLSSLPVFEDERLRDGLCPTCWR